MSQILTAIIDTQKVSYVPIGYINAGDSINLELEITMNEEPIIFNNPTFEYFALKEDKTRVRQIRDILYEDGKIKIKCDEQVSTCVGIVTNQLVIREEGQVSTCLFYLNVNPSLDRDIIQSIDKVEALQELDRYIATAFANLKEYEQRIIAGDSAIRKLNDDMIAAETNRENAEADRGSTFDNLVTRMNNVINVAITTDETLNNNETARINNFNTLKTELEQIREGLLNLNNSISLDEQNRVQAELDRANASIEAINRLNAINTNITNEEATRVQEWNNIKSENTTLKEALTTINNTANSNEEVRKKKEEERIAAEQQRQANFETMQQENNSFKERIDAQYEQINTKVISVEERVQAIEENGVGGGNANIDDTTISKISTWSSEKIEDFVHTNDDVVWSTVQGENLSIEYTKEGYLREVEILGNTWQDDTDSKNLFDGELRQGDISSSDGQDTTSSLRVSSVNFIPVNNSTVLYVYREIANGNFAFRCYDNNKNILGATDAFRTQKTFSVNLLDGTSYVRFIDETNDLTNKYSIAIESITDHEPYHKADLSTIKHLGELYVNEHGQPILDSEGKEQYKIEIESCNKNLFNPIQNIVDNSCFDDNGVINTLSGYAISLEYIRVKPLTSYICENSNYVAYYDKYKTFIKREEIFEYQSFTTPTHCCYVRFQIDWSQLENKDLNLLRFAEGLSTNRFKIPPHNSYKKTILLPCQLMKDKNVADRLYWDSKKEKYVVEKSTTNEIIETFILEPLKIPCYIDKTHLFVTGNLDGAIKAKIPLDGGQAIQTLSAKNVALNEEVITLSLENEEIKEVNNTQDILIDTTMMATDEVYTMLEPILEMMPMTISIDGEMKGGSSKMVDMYVAMVQRGLKTIEQVPARYREEVREILAKLEK